MSDVTSLLNPVGWGIFMLLSDTVCDGWVGGWVVWRYPAQHVVITNKRDHVLYETKRSYLNRDGVVLWGRGGGCIQTS